MLVSGYSLRLKAGDEEHALRQLTSHSVSPTVTLSEHLKWMTLRCSPVLIGSHGQGLVHEIPKWTHN
jgi:hypothetical protein